MFQGDYDALPFAHLTAVDGSRCPNCRKAFMPVHQAYFARAYIGPAIDD